MFISVVIPCYNPEHYLLETISSLFEQEYAGHDFEIILIDDHSFIPESISLLSGINEPKIRVYKNLPSNKGVSSARNYGASKALGEWLLFLDADDMQAKDSIRYRLAAIEQFPDAIWLGGDTNLIDEHSQLIETGFFRHRPLTSKLLSKAYDSDKTTLFNTPTKPFIQACLTSVGNAMVKKSAFEHVGGFSTTLTVAEDYQLWIKLAIRYDFVFIPHTLLLYRQHSSSCMATVDSHRVWTIKAFQALIKKPEFKNFIPELKKRIKSFHLENYYVFCKKKQYIKAFWSRLNYYFSKIDQRL
jgi:glycosyltransferase involved in cell wall biosynthesis